MNKLTYEQETALKNKSCETRCEQEVESDTCEDAFDTGYLMANQNVFEKIQSLFKDGYLTSNAYNTLILELFPKK